MYVSLFLPGIGGEVKLGYDSDLSKKLSTDGMRDEYQNQQK